MKWEQRATVDRIDRAAQVDYVSSRLLPRATLLGRLLIRQLPTEMSRSEAGVLNALCAGPRRITDLAELEGLAQPTMTLLVQRLEQQGLAARDRHADDGRVVLVSLTAAGKAALDDFIELVAVALREHLVDASDEQIAALAAATDTIETLIALMQKGSPDLRG
jgi:DNA-binding MarR family transcriptional regulator